MQWTRGGSRSGTGRFRPWLAARDHASEFRASPTLRTGAVLRQSPRLIAILSVSPEVLVRLGPAPKRASTRAFLSVSLMISRSVVDGRDLDRGRKTGAQTAQVG